MSTEVFEVVNPATEEVVTTLELTTLGRRGPGDLVNLEVDVLAKYVERLLTHRQEVAP